MIYFKRLFLYVSFFCLATFGCAAYADGPYHGRLIDAETKLPIEGAAVFAQWWVHHLGTLPPQSYYDAQETLTDQQGNFVIPGIMNPPTDPTVILDPPSFIIFKPDYQAIGGRRLKSMSPEDQAYSKIKDNVYEENGIMVVEVRRLTTREERLDNLGKISISSRVPEEKYPELIRFRNIERVNLGLKPLRPPKGK